LELAGESFDGLIGGTEGRNHDKEGRQQKEKWPGEVLFHLFFIITYSWVKPSAMSIAGFVPKDATDIPAENAENTQRFLRDVNFVYKKKVIF
jgi:hypothetical protein